MGPIVVTGATGTVGAAVARALAESGAETRRAVRPGRRRPATPPLRAPGADGARVTGAAVPAEDDDGGGGVAFDFLDPTTWTAAFTGAESLFLVRPPAVAHVRRDLLPAVAAARDAGVRHVVFLSLQGAEKNRVVPHAAVEAWLRASGMTWTFVRASFFVQNLSTTHAADIRDRDEILVPAGDGATAFVDADDVGAVAAAALLDPGRHANRAWTVTGSRALTYGEVAEVLGAELGRPIRYARPGLARYARHARRTLGMPVGMVAVTSAIYTAARLGLAAGVTDDVRTVLGRSPADLAAVAHRERAAWLPPLPGAANDDPPAAPTPRPTRLRPSGDPT